VAEVGWCKYLGSRRSRSSSEWEGRMGCGCAGEKGQKWRAGWKEGSEGGREGEKDSKGGGKTARKRTDRTDGPIRREEARGRGRERKRDQSVRSDR